MLLNIQEVLEESAKTACIKNDIRLSGVTVDAEMIKAVMINEVVPEDPDNDFYGKSPSPNYLSTTIPLFQKAGVQVSSIDEILSYGIYITNAVKRPKTEYTIAKSMIEESLPILEKEINLFPNLKVIMLMGDVAKKALNMIAKRKTNQNVIPAISTYKLRNDVFYYGTIRVFPSYIMTGKNILIEKSKFQMASEDIKKMMGIIA
ncbi:MAG: uracil-DNA glycosylase family protein [Firmicutes bacterium]|nr:uracil-DNA glycosylase family protein [Bacillota bacterium]